jgi:hypothetical protein
VPLRQFSSQRAHVWDCQVRLAGGACYRAISLSAQRVPRCYGRCSAPWLSRSMICTAVGFSSCHVLTRHAGLNICIGYGHDEAEDVTKRSGPPYQRCHCNVPLVHCVYASLSRCSASGICCSAPNICSALPEIRGHRDAGWGSNRHEPGRARVARDRVRWSGRAPGT